MFALTILLGLVGIGMLLFGTILLLLGLFSCNIQRGKEQAKVDAVAGVVGVVTGTLLLAAVTPNIIH